MSWGFNFPLPLRITQNIFGPVTVLGLRPKTNWTISKGERANSKRGKSGGNCNEELSNSSREVQYNNRTNDFKGGEDDEKTVRVGKRPGLLKLDDEVMTRAQLLGKEMKTYLHRVGV